MGRSGCVAAGHSWRRLGGRGRGRGRGRPRRSALVGLALLWAACGAQGAEAARAEDDAANSLAVAGTTWPGTLATQWTYTGASGPVRFAVDGTALDSRSSLWPAVVAGRPLVLPLCGGTHTLVAETLVDGTRWSAPSQAQVTVDTQRQDAGLGVGFGCFVAAHSAVYCLGVNDRGQLGVGDALSRGADAAHLDTSATQVSLPATSTSALAVGGAHVCALATDGTVRCWGDNLSGQFGLAKGPQDLGTSAQDLGQALTPLALPAKATHLAAGGTLTAALLADGQVVAWGAALDAPTPTAVPAPAGAGAPIALAAGDAHLCMLTDQGRVACVGRNEAAQLGTGDTTARAPAHAETVDLGTGRSALLLRAGGQQTCAVLDDLTLKCWGRVAATVSASQTGDALPALPALPLGQSRYPVDLAVGGGHACALRDDGSIVCWGLNDQGQLGQGTAADAVYPAAEADGSATAPPAVDLGTAPAPRAVVAGATHTCALLVDGSRRCWGGNQFGQLGLGDSRSRGQSAEDLGAALSAVRLPL